MMRLVNDDQSGDSSIFFQLRDSHWMDSTFTVPDSFPIPYLAWFPLSVAPAPAVRHYPDTGTGTVEEFPHHRRQQMSLSCACRHLHHDTLMKLPLLKEPGLHFLLVVTKTVVFAIHRRMPVATDNKKKEEGMSKLK